MKRPTLIMTLLLTAAVLVAGLAVSRHVAAQRYGGFGGYGPGMMWDEDFGGPGWGAGHRGWGGPGFMWGGRGRWGDWEGFGDYGQVPADKRAQLRELDVETQRNLVGRRAAMEELMIAYSQAVQKYPLDREAAAKAWQGMQAIRKEMLELRLESMTKAQHILGKELWDKAHEGWGPGAGWGRGRRGPPGPR